MNTPITTMAYRWKPAPSTSTSEYLRMYSGTRESQGTSLVKTKPHRLTDSYTRKKK
jgi:hypothetical protein